MKKIITLIFCFRSFLFFEANYAEAQISQFELKETRTYLGTTNNYGTIYNLYNYAGASNTISVPDGKKITILDTYQKLGNHGSTIVIELQYNNSSDKYKVFYVDTSGSSATPSPSPSGKTFIGPCNVYISLIGVGRWQVSTTVNVDTDTGYNANTTLWRYEISNYYSDSLTSTSPLISSTAVVVPSNATGDVDVLLEQSTDMITWTQCLPGTYNASTQKRFFRVRAVEK